MVRTGKWFIRHPAVAGRERGTRDAMVESFFGYDGAEHWELQWDTSIQRKGHSKYGITGFARVISRSSGAAVSEPFIRAHLCKHNPCRADWTHDSKYGQLPRPLHFQPSEDWRPHAPPAIPAPVPPPAVVHWHPVDAPLEAGGDDDEVSEGDPESSSSSSLEAGGDDDEVAEADADL